MNQHIVKMMSGSIQSKKLIVESMRQPCQRMPIRRRLRRCERPLDRAPGQSILNVRISGNVFLIVQDDKSIPEDWAVERNNHGPQQNTENDIQFLPGEECSRFARRFWFAAFCGSGHALSRGFVRGSFRPPHCKRILSYPDFAGPDSDRLTSTLATSPAYLAGSPWASLW